MKNWQIKKLGELCKIGAGNSAPQKERFFFNGIYPFFRTSDVGQIHMGNISESVDLLNEEGVQGLKLLPKGTILMPKSGASTFLNHRVIMDVEGYVSCHLATIQAHESVLSTKFLFYFLTTIKIQDLMQDHKYPSLNLPLIKNIFIPLPPLPEQQRIVKILDEAFEAIEKTKENVERNLENAKGVFKAILEDIALCNSENWSREPLKNLVIFKGGGTPSTKNPKYWDGDIPWVSPKDMKYSEILDSIDHVSEQAVKESSTLLIPSGSILIVVRSGILARTIPLAIAKKEITLNQDMKAMIPKPGIDSKFFYWTLLGLERKLLGMVSKGATVHRLPFEHLANLKISSPASLPEQRSIVARLDKLSAESKELETIYKRKLACLEELKKSLFQKAFAGEL